MPFAFAIWDDYLFTLSRKRTGSKAWIEVRSPDGIPLFEQELDLRRVRDIEVNCRNRLYLLAQIDLSTGQIEEPVPLNILFYDEIAIYNSTAFVLGTPTAHAASDVKRLYTKALW